MTRPVEPTAIKAPRGKPDDGTPRPSPLTFGVEEAAPLEGVRAALAAGLEGALATDRKYWRPAPVRVKGLKLEARAVAKAAELFKLAGDASEELERARTVIALARSLVKIGEECGELDDFLRGRLELDGAAAQTLSLLGAVREALRGAECFPCSGTGGVELPPGGMSSHGPCPSCTGRGRVGASWA